MESVPGGTGRQRALYGVERLARDKEARQKLQRSHVFQEGEYNYTQAALNRGVWRTSFQTDYPAKKLEHSSAVAGSSQFHFSPHFSLGHDSSVRILPEIYRQSTTKADFRTKVANRARTCTEGSSSLWPTNVTNTNSTEYVSAFLPTPVASGPTFPKVNTAVMKLPLDPARFWLQRGSNFNLGHYDTSTSSEYEQAFGRSGLGLVGAAGKGFGTEVDKAAQAKREMLVSHVLQTDDVTECMNDFRSTTKSAYGPPHSSQSAQFQAMQNLQKQVMPAKSPTSLGMKADFQNGVSHRLSDIRETVPGAGDGKKYQMSKNFEFGSDDVRKQTIYDKDYIPHTIKPQAKVSPVNAVDKSKLLQNDPNFSKIGISSHRCDHLYLPVVGSGARNLLDINRQKHVPNLTLTSDPYCNQEDRRRSLSHQDYNNLVHAHKSHVLAVIPRLQFDLLRSNDALPYPGPEPKSEAMESFSGPFLPNTLAAESRRERDQQCRDRLSWGRQTHFDVGFASREFQTEHNDRFGGGCGEGVHTVPAGITEGPSEASFQHLTVSSNTQDMQAADPHQVTSKEALKTRLQTDRRPGETAFGSSLMKSDYKPLEKRRLTEDQMKTVEKFETLSSQPFEQAHLFHTDSSSKNNFQTTAMEDYIKPEHMTGRKFLAAR